MVLVGLVYNLPVVKQSKALPVYLLVWARRVRKKRRKVQLVGARGMNQLFGGDQKFWDTNINVGNETGKPALVRE